LKEQCSQLPPQGAPIKEAPAPNPSDEGEITEEYRTPYPERSPPKPRLTACPFCGGEVARRVIKCRHCGETLDAGARAAEEARREASLLAESTDVFGVVGFIIGLFSVASLLLVCCLGIGVLIVVPLGMAGAGCSLFGRSNLRVAGLVVNGIAVFVGLVAGVAWLMWMVSMSTQRPRYSETVPILSVPPLVGAKEKAGAGKEWLHADIIEVLATNGLAYQKIRSRKNANMMYYIANDCTPGIAELMDDGGGIYVGEATTPQFLRNFAVIDCQDRQTAKRTRVDCKIALPQEETSLPYSCQCHNVRDSCHESIRLRHDPPGRPQ
jgi:hypothetical protein